MKDNHPEASQYEEYADSLTFHESKQFEADGQKVAMVDIDETICFILAKDGMTWQNQVTKILLK